jgi:phosphoenolpyruvate carboxykinase (ATP)
MIKFAIKHFSRSIRQSLESFGITPHTVFHNLSVAELYEQSIRNYTPVDQYTNPTEITSTGAIAAFSGKKTGRSPKDKRIVKESSTEHDMWWGPVNAPMTPKAFKMHESRCLDYLSSRPRLYVVDGYAGWDPKYRIKVRVVACRAYHALFMRNMLIVPTKEELERDFKSDPDYHIFNAGELSAGNLYEGVDSKTCVALSFNERKLVILGTQYAGEMKKGVFTIMHYLMPKRGILSMHSSANEGPNGDVSLLFGLSGTGKTTLSADPSRKLIGDDEHCWSDDGIFNIEGGCYAKCVGLTKEKEPEIFEAVKYGSVLENIVFKDTHSREVDFNDTSITENTRVCYPLEYIPGAKIPALGGHPKNIFFLTCDAYGVLPPVSKLTYEQAMYHFISGYTAKVAGTEIGVKEPTSTFSACFGEAFLPLHPTVYAELLAKKMKKHGTHAWLINTGWSGGRYGVGQRMDLKTTRNIIDAIHSGQLDNVKTEKMPVFGLGIPENVPGVRKEILNPIDTWHSKEEYNRIMMTLAKDFIQNFKKYEDKASPEIINAGPKI